jgi:hypothetical protein
MGGRGVPSTCQPTVLFSPTTRGKLPRQRIPQKLLFGLQYVPSSYVQCLLYYVHNAPIA